jgi:5'-nucleotidase/UDP-sugar diphosphatase
MNKSGLIKFLCGEIILTLVTAPAYADLIPLTILHTNDLHSHFEGTGPDSTMAANPASSKALGGYARLSCAINAIRTNKQRTQEPVLLFDAGDFFSGTIFHTIAPQLDEPASPELEFFSRMHYDAITLGNHEFDTGRLGLQRIISKAKKRGASVPIVTSNLNPLSFVNRDDESSLNLLNQAVFEIKTPSRTLKVGVLGFASPNTIMLSSHGRDGMKFFGFNDENSREDSSEFFEAARASVESLRASENPDLVVALLHGGEIDKRLANKVPGINVIISGHTHEKYAIKQNGTIIAQTGSYGENLGNLSLTYDTNTHTADFSSPNASQDHLVAMNSHSCWDNTYGKEISLYRETAIRALASTQFKYDTPIVRVEKNLERKDQSRLPLGIFVWSNVRKALNSKLAKPVDVYLGNLGVLRAGFKTLQGEPTVYQFSDIFKILSVGFETIPNPVDPSKTKILAGSPIVVFHLQKNELKSLIEFMEFYGKFSNVAIPALSDNVTYRERWWGIPLLNRLADFRVDGKSMDELPPLLSVATTAYVASFFKNLKGITYGLVNVTPRNEQGMPISEFTPANVPRDFELLAEALKTNNEPVR